MIHMTISRAAEACRGRLCGELREDAALNGVTIDSRAVEPGDLFVAYEGERVDGHDYISAAFDRGAACCLARRLPAGETRPVILAPDVQEALENLCRELRKEIHIPVVGVTGSVGKTTAKEMAAAVLGSRLAVLKTDKNLNNRIGVPMTLSRVAPEHQAAVVEMGISDFGEMSRLAQMVRPTVAVFTVIGHAHWEFLHDLDGVLKAKTEMLDYMADDALVVLNGDDEKLKTLRCRQRVLRFGLGEDCQVRAEDIALTKDRQIDCVIVRGRRRIPAHIPAYGRHMVYAALAGAAVGMELGLTDEEIARGIGAYQTVGRRAAVTDTGYLTLVDDSYNANPDSMASGLASLRDLPGRRVCVLGDMLELGENARRMHYDVGRLAVESGAALVLCCGPLAEEICRGAGAAGRHYADTASLCRALPELIQKGDTVFVKASQAMRLDTVAEALKKLPGREERER